MDRKNAVALAWNLTDFVSGPVEAFVMSDGEIWIEEDRQTLIESLRNLKSGEAEHDNSCDALISYAQNAKLDSEGRMD